VSVGFAAALAVVADLAWATAVATTGPWYDPGISAQVYSIGVVAGSVLALVLVGVAASRAARLDEEIQGLGLRLARFRSTLQSRKEGDRDDPLAGLDALGDLEDTLVLPSTVGSGYVAVTAQVTRDALSAPGASVLPAGERAVLRELLAQRRALLRERSGVWFPVAGPVAAGVAFVLLAGAMLPGVEGFAVANHHINTTLLLFLSYGWPFLLAWAIVGIVLLHALPERRGTRTVDDLDGLT